MPIFRFVRLAPVILSFGIVVFGIFGTSANISTLLNFAVNHVLRSTSNGSYSAELQGLSGVSLDGLDAETIVVHATTETAPVRQLHISRVRVRFDLLSLFRGAGLNGFRQLEVAEIAILMRPGTLNSAFSRGDTRGEIDDDDSPTFPLTFPSDRIAIVEQRISQALSAIPNGIHGPIAVSLYEAMDEDRGNTPDVPRTTTPSGTVPRGTEAPFSVHSIRIATADLSVAPGTADATVTYAAYTVSLHVQAADNATVAAEMWGNGPGAAVAAGIDQRGITFSAKLSPQDFQLPSSVPLPEALRAFDTASVSFRLDRSGAQQVPPSPQEPTVGAASSILALEETLGTFRSLLADAGEETAGPVSLPTIHTTFTIHDVNPAGFHPTLDGIPAIHVVSAEIHTTEDGIGGSATIDGGASGTLSARDVFIPAVRSRRISAAEVRIDIPPEIPVSLKTLPPQVLATLRALGMVEAAGNVTPPSLSLMASAENGLIHATARAAHPGGFTVSTVGLVDLVDETIALSSVQSRWNGGMRTVEANASFRATWDEISSLDAFSPIPDGVQSELAVRFETDDITADLDAKVTDGRVTINKLEASYGGHPYTLTGTGETGAPTVPQIESQPGAYRLTQSQIGINPGTVTLRDMVMTADGVSGSIEYNDLPVTRILEALGTTREAAPGVAEPMAVDSYPSGAITGGNLSGDVRFNTEYLRPRLAATVRGEAFSVFSETGSFVVELEQDATSIRVDRGEIDLGDLLTGTFSGRLPIAATRSGLLLLNLTDSALNASLQSARFDTFFPRDTEELRPEGALTVEMELLEQTGDLHAEIDFRVRPETIDGGANDFSGFGYERLRGTIRATEDRFDRLTIGFKAAADGKEILDASAEVHIPGLSRAAPTIVPQEIAWQLEGSSELPLEYIAPFLPGVVALTGRVSGSITGGGTLGTPTLDGRISVIDGELRTAGPIPPISAMNGAIRFQDARFFTEQFSAESGLSPFTMSVDGTLPRDGAPATLTATLQGDNLLVTTSPLLRVRADADLSLTGSFAERLSLNGLITIRDGLYSRDIPLIDFDTVPSIDPDMLQLFSVQNSFATRTDLDLRIIADETFRVENNLYQGAFSSDLTLGGTLEVPRPQGRVFADSGQLMLPLTSLRMEQAVLRFPRDRPFTPDIQARGAALLRDYQLSVAVSGTIPGVEVNVTTTPPLPQGDALVLLSTGFTPQELAGSGNRAALAIGSRLGTQFVQSLVGTAGGETGEVLADRVSVLLGEGVSESGAETIEIEFRLTEEDSWFLVFHRDRYERYNMDLAWRFWLD